MTKQTNRADSGNVQKNLHSFRLPKNCISFSLWPFQGLVPAGPPTDKQQMSKWGNEQKTMNKQTHKQANNETNKETNKQTNKDGQTGKQTNKQTSKQTNKQINKQINKRTNTYSKPWKCLKWVSWSLLEIIWRAVARSTGRNCRFHSFSLTQTLHVWNFMEKETEAYMKIYSLKQQQPLANILYRIQAARTNE